MHALFLSLITTGLAGSDAQPAFDAARAADWQGLDLEIHRLTESLAHEGEGPHISGFGQFSFWNSSDTPFQVGGENVSGFSVDYARVEFTGNVNETRYEVSFDGRDGGADIVDAFAGFRIAGGVNGTFGMFRPPLLHSALKYKPDTLLSDRSLLGETYSERDTGLMLSGSSGPLDWYLAVQNGVDDVGDSYLFTGRLVYDFLGDAFASDKVLAGYGDKPQFSVGLAAQRDEGLSNGDLAAVDLAFAQGPLLVAGEFVQYDQLYDGSVVDPVTGSSVADTSPFSATAAFQFGDSSWQFVARLEEVDDPLNTGRVSLGLNKVYDDEGRIRWQVVVTDQQSDLSALEGTLVGVALTIVY